MPRLGVRVPLSPPFVDMGGQCRVRPAQHNRRGVQLIWPRLREGAREVILSVLSKFRRAEVAERQTRYVQDVVPARVCGFKSLLRHHTSIIERL